MLGLCLGASMISTEGICVDDYGIWRDIGGRKIIDRFPSTNCYSVGIYDWLEVLG